MKFTTIAVAALSLAFLAACDRGEPRPKTGSPAASGSSAATSPSGAPQSKTPMSSDNAGKRETTPPVQGREDTRQSEQTRDFKHPDTGGK